MASGGPLQEKPEVTWKKNNTKPEKPGRLVRK